jgi:predicted phage terminase large subunit-like protein
MKCIPPTDGLCDPRDVVFVPVDVIRQLLPRLRLHVTIDLHGMEQSRDSDFTAMTLGGFDRDGRLYIIDCKLGRFTPEEVIKNIFELHRDYPQIIDFKIEKDAHARVLLPFLQREMSKRQRFPTVWPIPRDTHTSKKHRIRGLRPWFKAGILVFSQGLSAFVKTELLTEVARFPSESAGVHDDILDTLADQMQNQEGGLNVDVVADPPDIKTSIFGQQRPRERFMGFREGDGVSQWLYGNDEKEDGPRSMTGVL